MCVSLGVRVYVSVGVGDCVSVCVDCVSVCSLSCVSGHCECGCVSALVCTRMCHSGFVLVGLCICLSVRVRWFGCVSGFGCVCQCVSVLSVSVCQVVGQGVCVTVGVFQLLCEFKYVCVSACVTVCQYVGMCVSVNVSVCLCVSNCLVVSVRVSRCASQFQ